MKKKTINYIGQTTYNRQGYEMMIIDAQNTHNITVHFPEFGIVKRKKYYRDFLHGLISIDSDLIPKRIGQRKQMKNGEYCTIVEYNKSGDCKVKFDSGYEKKTSYSHFERGEVGNHDKRKDVINKIYITKNSNEKYRIVEEYKETKEVLVEFLPTGEKYKYTRADAMRGIIASKKHPIKREEKFAVGKTLKSKKGIEYTIEKFNADDKTIDISSINGYESRVDPFSIEKRCELSLREIVEKRLATYNSHQMQLIKSLMGNEYFATNGSKIVIVGGSSYVDIWVKDEEGNIYKNNKLRDVIKNKTCIGSAADTRSRRKAQEIEGRTIISTAGFNATVTKYHSAKEVDVKIETAPGEYELRTVSAYQARLGQCNPSCTNEVDGSSINEHAFLYILKPYGFIKAKKGSLSKLKGFGNCEIDIYNEEHKLAIEYDGYYHQKEVVIERDIKKDKILKAYGIKVIRIRAGVPMLNDGIAEEIQMTDLHFCSPEMRKVAHKLAQKIHQEIGVVIDVPDLTNKELQRKIIESYAQKTSRRKHIGEPVWDKNGRKGHIIDYLDGQHIKVKFDNGYITPYFDSSNIKNLCCQDNHFGEENISRRNEKMKIISDRYDSRKVDVQFEEGTIVRNQSYLEFTRGRIVNPNYDSTRKYIGKTMIAKNKLKATIERAEVTMPRYVTYVYGSFEDGSPFRCSWAHFQQGYIRHE